MEELFSPPPLPGAAGGERRETCHYRAAPRPKSKFKTVLDAQALFGGAATAVRVDTVLGPQHLDLDVKITLAGGELHDALRCQVPGGLRAERLVRRAHGSDGQPTRHHEVWFQGAPFDLPATTYPEVLLPFLLRGQPRDKHRRALHAWTNDGFCARVWYENRGRARLDVPAGRFEVEEVWMYPDLNDWIALGSALTRLAKPLLPRYQMWFEAGGAQRLVRFEGSYGPPGAPEVVLELAG
ncbi:MAG: hypothetical protein H6706_19915 [Myxococcales bacterium]|nr:hypothetical protein [Myxococcales bacterium]